MGKPTVSEHKTFCGSKMKGKTLAATWSVHKEITPTGELLEEKLSGFQAP